MSAIKSHSVWYEKFSMLEKFILAAIALLLALQIHIQFVQEINWDEFYFLSMIYEHQRGELTKALQTFHVHLFGWLPAFGQSEVRQIEIARVIMWFFEIGTMVCIYAVMRAFLPRSAALICVLGYISAGYIFAHGTSFRADPIAAFFMMFGIAVLVRSNLTIAHLAAFCIAVSLAVMITVKVVFYAPALIGIALWRLSNSAHPRALFIRLCIAAITVLALCGGLYAVQLSLITAADTEGSKAMMSSAYKTTLLSSGLFPRLDSILVSISTSLAQTLLFIMGGAALFLSAFSKKTGRKTALMLFILASPILSFVIYRNAFPYYFAFVFPPAMGLIGYGFIQLKPRALLEYGLVLTMLIGGISQYVSRFRSPQTTQTATINMVHKIFPEPVFYIDRCAMISSFTKKGFFMSSWGTQTYRRDNLPVLSTALRDQVTPLLIVNTPILLSAFEGVGDAEQKMPLLQKDAAALRENFIHHWGYIWVAGKHLNVSTTEVKFQISIPGKYTLETDTIVLIDESVYKPGQVINLQRGTHTISANEDVSMSIRWGDHLFKPDMKPPLTPIFTGF